jgi:signal transduction histidine kinase
MNESRNRYRAVLSDALTAWARVAGIPVGLCEIHKGELVFPLLPPHARAHFPAHRITIPIHIPQSVAIPQDELRVQIMVNGEARALLLYGDALLDMNMGICLPHLKKTIVTFLEAVYRAEDMHEERYRAQEEAIARTTLGTHLLTHEVQNGVQAVIADIEELMGDAATLSLPELLAGLLTVQQNAQVLSTVAYTLGDWRQLEEYKFEDIRVASLVSEAKRLYSAMAAKRYIEIHDKLESRDQLVPGSRFHLQLALNNLVHNAVKYSFKGGWRQWNAVWIVGRLAGESYVLTIQNRGVGVLPEEITSGAIFQEGYQGKLTKGEYRPGAGKGLAFATRVVAEHGGHITATSTLIRRASSRRASVSGSQNMEQKEDRGYMTRFSIHLPMSPNRKVDEKNGEEQANNYHLA